MQIVALTDIHGNVQAVQRAGKAIAGADLVLLTGDLTHFGRRPDALAVLEAVRRFNARVLAVAGNCDHPEVENYLADEGISLDGTHRIVDGLAFLGVGGSLPCPGRTPNERSEAELAAALSEAAASLRPDLPSVLVSHQPPRHTALDRVRNGAHVGSTAVRQFIEALQHAVCFTGHIHEATGTDSIGPTRMINPGPAHMGRCAYAEVTRGLDVLEIRSV